MNLLPNGTTIGKAQVIVDIVKKGNKEIRPETAMKPQYVTIHNTGNTGRGANAKSHNIYIHNLAGKQPKDTTHVSWHITVDENFIYQHIPFNETAWHCGDGANGTGNRKSIGIEICHHVDQKNYAQAEANAVALTAYLIKQLSIPLANVRPHKDWSGKNCPQVILGRDGNLNKFRANVDVAYKALTKPVVATPKPAPTPTPTNTTNVTHKVVSGDTLYKISLKYNISVAEIQALNNLKNTTIHANQVLIVGKKVVEAPKPTPTPTPTPVAKPKEEVKTVDKFNPSNKYIKEYVIEAFKALEAPRKDGKQPISSEWRLKFEKGELTESDAIGILFTAILRGLI